MSLSSVEGEVVSTTGNGFFVSSFAIEITSAGDSSLELVGASEAEGGLLLFIIRGGCHYSFCFRESNAMEEMQNCCLAHGKMYVQGAQPFQA